MNERGRIQGFAVARHQHIISVPVFIPPIASRLLLYHYTSLFGALCSLHICLDILVMEWRLTIRGHMVPASNSNGYYICFGMRDFNNSRVDRMDFYYQTLSSRDV